MSSIKKFRKVVPTNEELKVISDYELSNSLFQNYYRELLKNKDFTKIHYGTLKNRTELMLEYFPNYVSLLNNRYAKEQDYLKVIDSYYKLPYELVVDKDIFNIEISFDLPKKYNKRFLTGNYFYLGHLFDDLVLVDGEFIKTLNNFLNSFKYYNVDSKKILDYVISNNGNYIFC